MEKDKSKIRRWLARVVLLVAVVMAVGVLTNRQVEVFVALGVGPVMRSDDGKGLRREAVEVIHLTLHDEDGERVAQSVMHLPHGIDGPASPPLVVRVPTGTYVAQVLLQGPERRRVTRHERIEFAESGYLHVDLD